MTDISKTAEKVLAALELLREGMPLTPTDLALRLGENRTVSQRLLTTLLERGFVVRNNGAYTLSSKVRSLADAVQPTLREAVSAHMASLSGKIGETVVFQIPDGDQAVVLEQHLQNESVALQVRHDIGARSPLVQTANGLAILSALDPGKVEALLSDAVSSSSVLAALERIRATGFALTSEGLQIGVSGMAVAVQRGSDVVGSLAILVPSFREDALEKYQAPLYQTAQRIEQTLNG